MKEKSDLVKKWSGTGLLETAIDPLRKKFVAEKLEETADWMIVNQCGLGNLLVVVARIAKIPEIVSFDVSTTINLILEPCKNYESEWSNFRNDVSSVSENDFLDLWFQSKIYHLIKQ